MIKRIKGRFEAHQETEIELSPGLTAIVGPNDEGKSAINRMLRWVACNFPRGSSMIPWEGKKQAGVTVENDTGSVTLSSNGAKRSYAVDASVFEAFGSSVPEEVTEALKIDGMNLQTQVDQYFLLQATGGEIAKKINQVAGIDSSDAVIKHTNKLISATESSVKSIKENIGNLNVYLNENSAIIDEADERYEGMAAIRDKISEATSFVESASKLTTLLKESTCGLNRFEKLPVVHATTNSIKALDKEIEDLSAAIRNAGALSTEIRSIDLKAYSFLDEIDVGVMKAIAEQVKKRSERVEKMTELSKQISEVKLERYSCLEQVGLAAEAFRVAVTKIADLGVKLNSAKFVSGELNKDLSAWEFLNRVNLDPIKTLSTEVDSVAKKLDVLKELKMAETVSRELEEELQRLKAEHEKLTEICPECGQRRPSGGTDHSHS